MPSLSAASRFSSLSSQFPSQVRQVCITVCLKLASNQILTVNLDASNRCSEVDGFRAGS